MKSNFQRLLVLLAAGLLFAAGCEQDQREADGEQEGKEVIEEDDEAEEPAVDKLVYAFQPQENPEAITPDAEKLAEYLEEQTGIESEVYLPTNYAGVVEALRAKNADVAYFSGWPYLIASQEAGVELLVAEERDGEPFYHSQWYVREDSDIDSLEQLEGKSIAFTSPTSTSGYLFPLAKVIEEGHIEKGGDPKSFFGNVIYAGGYEQALQALAEGKVDAAAASDYAPERYLDEETQAKIKVLSKQGPVPTHNIGIRGDLPDEVKTKVKEALLSLNDSENKELLKSVYGAEKLVERTHDEHVAALAKSLELVGDDQGAARFGDKKKDDEKQKADQDAETADEK
ncbi:MAG: phosphate/phosphite/phosphonate ABC transporter substrate-binding protein [Persicimonas sp.]